MQLHLQSSRSPIKRVALADRVYETLLESIVSGRLAPGTSLSVVALADELDVSRTPVHDALRQLVSDGLVDQEMNRQARVANFTRSDVFEIFEMRKLLEGPAAALAAVRMSESALAELRSIAKTLVDFPQLVDWHERWVAFDEVFHERIGEASGIRRLAMDIERYRLLHRGFNYLVSNVDHFKTALDEHLKILDALEKRDAAEASRCMLTHLETWQVYFVKHFPR